MATASNLPGEILEIPDGLHDSVKVGKVALALNMSSATVKGWLDSGALPSWRPDEGRGWRYVRLPVLAQFAERHGLPVNWEVLL